MIDTPISEYSTLCGSSACGAAECPEEPPCVDGDATGDGVVNVTDIVIFVETILGD